MIQIVAVTVWIQVWPSRWSLSGIELAFPLNCSLILASSDCFGSSIHTEQWSGIIHVTGGKSQILNKYMITGKGQGGKVLSIVRVQQGDPVHTGRGTDRDVSCAT